MDMLGPEGVYEDRGRLYTESACPGRRVYGERLVRSNGRESSAVDKVAENAALMYIERNGLPLNVLSEEIGFVDNGGEEGGVRPVALVDHQEQVVQTCFAHVYRMPVLGGALPRRHCGEHDHP